MYGRLLPAAVRVTLRPGSSPDDVPLLRDRPALDGRETAYVCEGYACRLPTTDVETVRAQLDELVRGR